jgi:hypothetical protein
MTSTQQKPDTFKSLSLPDYTERYPGNGSGLWPTPTSKEQCGSVEKWAERRSAARLEHNNGNGFGMPLDMAVKQWPTPLGTVTNPRDDDLIRADGLRVYRRASGQSRGIDLATSVKCWPTPVKSDYKGPNFSGGDSLSANGLAAKVATWPTPTASEGSKIPSRPNYGQVGLSNHPDIVGAPDRPKMAKDRKGSSGRTIHEGQNQPNAALSPDWVEWLMGLPKGWTSLEPMDPDAFEEWATDMTMGTWWATERGIPRVTTERTNRVKRLKALGNGIVPASCALFAGTVKRD